MRGNASTTDSGAGSERVDSESDIDWLWISSKTWWIEIEIRTESEEKIWMQRWAKGRKWKQVRDGLYSGNKAQIQDSTLYSSRILEAVRKLIAKPHHHN